MTVLRELITVLGFKVDDAEAAQAEKVFDGLKKGAVAVVAAATLAAAAIGVLIKQTVAAGDQAAKTGKRLGITAEEVQELAFAAERSGVPIAQLNQGLRSLQRRAADSIGQNNEFAKGFARLGVRVTDANGKLKPTVQLLGEVATAFQGITDEGERTALAMKVAGDGGAALLPLFLEGAEGIDALRRRARVLGFVLDNETAEATERLADNFTDLQLLVTGLGRRIATQLLPLVEKITNATINWFIANRDLIDRGIKRLTSFLLGAVKALVSFARLIDENKRFLIILALVLTALVFPALLTVAKGYALVALAAIKTALVAAAPFLLIIALAILIALVIEDVFVFVSGGESAIGNLFDFFTAEAIKPGAHWMVQVLAAIIATVRDVILAIDDLFKIIFAQALAGGGILEGLGRTMSMAGEGVVLLFKNILDSILNTLTMAGEGMILFFKDVGKAIFESIEKAIKDALKLLPGGGRLGEFAFGGAGDLLSRAFGGDDPGSAPASRPGGGGGNVQNAIGGRSVSVSVDASSTTDPQAVADATAQKVGQVLEDDRRETTRILTAGGGA